MRDFLPELLRDRSGPEARNLLREYLQAVILASLQRSGAMIPLALSRRVRQLQSSVPFVSPVLRGSGRH